MIGEDLVTLARFDRPIDAHLARSKLVNSGIPAIVINDGIDNLMVYTAVCPGIVRLQVHAGNAPAARDLLGMGPADTAAPTGETTECPYCGSGHVEYAPRALPLRMIFMLVMAMVILCQLPWGRDLTRRRRRCLDCGKKWPTD